MIFQNKFIYILFFCIINSLLISCSSSDNKSEEQLTGSINNIISITTQPADSTVLLGGKATFRASALSSDGSPLSYQWQKAPKGSTVFTDVGFKNANYVASVGSIYATSVAATDDGTKYRVVVKTESGLTATSNVATIIISGVNITTQPSNAVVLPNSIARFSVVAVAKSSGLRYQWQKAPKGSTIFTSISGATNANYSIASVTDTDDGVQYRVIVTSGVATTTSSVATIIISNIFITTQPSNATILPNSMATFSVVASTNNGSTLSYQWQKATNGSNTFTPISGATNTNYSIAGVAGDTGNQYRVIITAGQVNTTSASATLTVADIGISTQPYSVVIPLNSNTMFSVVASTNNGDSLSYQWQTAPNGSTSFTGH